MRSPTRRRCWTAAPSLGPNSTRSRRKPWPDTGFRDTPDQPRHTLYLPEQRTPT
jgi:hypothetical protein